MAKHWTKPDFDCTAGENTSGDFDCETDESGERRFACLEYRLIRRHMWSEAEHRIKPVQQITDDEVLIRESLPAEELLPAEEGHANMQPNCVTMKGNLEHLLERSHLLALEKLYRRNTFFAMKKRLHCGDTLLAMENALYCRETLLAMEKRPYCRETFYAMRKGLYCQATLLFMETRLYCRETLRSRERLHRRETLFAMNNRPHCLQHYWSAGYVKFITVAEVPSPSFLLLPHFIYFDLLFPQFLLTHFN